MRTTELILLIFLSLGFVAPASAQQELRQPLTMKAAEDSFLVKNYLLLAQRYQVDADKALIRQAKLWDNPSFSALFGFNSTNNIKPFYIGKGGQTQYTIDQVVQLAGKRNKSIQLATTKATLSEATFDELLRTLRMQLRQHYFNLYFQQQTETVLRTQLRNLQEIVEAYTIADKKGSVAHADLIRLKALQIGLENDYADFKQQELESQKNLQQLLHTQDFYSAEMQPVDTERYSLDGLNLQQLLDYAAQNRPDVKMAQAQYLSATANYQLQKALATPNLHVGANYDKHGTYIDNFIGLQVGIDLPFWNRNQGNIRSAKLQVSSEELQLKQQQSVAQTEVLNAFEQIRAIEKRYPGVVLENFQQEYNKLIDEVAKNFSKGNISLLQFIDYFNSYSDHVKNINRFLANRMNAYEELNYATGQELFNKK